MPVSLSPMQPKTPTERAHPPFVNVLKALLEMINCRDQNGAAGEQGNDNEEILMDTEVGGRRYLLVRMPLLRSQIQLSPREQEIVRMVAKGHPNKIIADVLNISAWTVCTHLRRIFAKLGVGSRAAMVARLHELDIRLEVVPPVSIQRSAEHSPPTQNSRACVVVPRVTR